MRATCSYAACHCRAVTTIDGWDFCRPHVAEHLGDAYASFGTPLDAEQQWEGEVWARASDRASRLDAKLRRCTCCGEWAWDRQDCSVCLTPAAHEGRVVAS